MVTFKPLQEAQALLGKLEYQRGNVEGALRVFDGIDLKAAIQRLQPSLLEKPPVKKGPSRGESPSSVTQHAASMVLEAIYLKAKSLQKLGKFDGIELLTSESYSLLVVNLFFFFGMEIDFPYTCTNAPIIRTQIPCSRNTTVMSLGH